MKGSAKKHGRDRKAILLINSSIEIPDSRGSSDPDLKVAGYSIEGKADDEWQVLQEADEAQRILNIKLMK